MAFAIANYSLSLGAMTLGGVLYRNATKESQALGDNIDQQTHSADYADTFGAFVGQFPERRCVSEPNLTEDHQALEAQLYNEGDSVNQGVRIRRSLSEGNLTFFREIKEEPNQFMSIALHHLVLRPINEPHSDWKSEVSYCD